MVTTFVGYCSGSRSSAACCSMPMNSPMVRNILPRLVHSMEIVLDPSFLSSCLAGQTDPSSQLSSWWVLSLSMNHRRSYCDNARTHARMHARTHAETRARTQKRAHAHTHTHTKHSLSCTHLHTHNARATTTKTMIFRGILVTCSLLLLIASPLS